MIPSPTINIKSYTVNQLKILTKNNKKYETSF